MLLEVVLWASVAVVAYHHFLYPLLLKLLARRLRRRETPPPALADEKLPTVTLIVPAHNEEAYIAAKLADLAALSYPQGKLRVVLALDGCTDKTRAIAEATGLFRDRPERFVLVEYTRNRGKVALLNEQIADAGGEIVALSDTSALLGPDALRRAAAHFADPRVGVVCPTYRLAGGGSEGERAYWRHQVRIKADEAAVAAPMGAHGSFYLFRRSAWTPLPADTINDDFVLPMTVVLKGYSAVYDPEIAAAELERSEKSQELRRRLRIGAGNLQQAVRLAGLANPLRPALAFVFLSGKGLRPAVPFLVVVGTAAAAQLAAGGSAFYLLLLIIGLVALAAGALLNFADPDRLPKPLAWLAYFVAGHAASAAGSLLFLARRHARVWHASTTAKTGSQPNRA